MDDRRATYVSTGCEQRTSPRKRRLICKGRAGGERRVCTATGNRDSSGLRHPDKLEGRVHLFDAVCIDSIGPGWASIDWVEYRNWKLLSNA
jgi:hypothetical protein